MKNGGPSSWPAPQREDDGKECHLAQEYVVVEVVSGVLLQPGQEAPQAGAEPQHGGQPPEVVRQKDRTKARNVKPGSERASPSPDGTQSDSESEQVQAREHQFNK